MTDKVRWKRETRKMAIACAPLTLLTFAAPAHAQTRATIDGEWVTNDNSAVIRVGPCSGASGGVRCGTIIRLLGPQPAGGRRDANNPDRAQRTRPVLGINVLWGLRANGAEWTGRGYTPQEGRNFSATVTQPSPDRLSVRGCVLVICRTVTWNRVRP